MNHEPFVDVKTLEDRYATPASWWYTQAESGAIPSYKVGRYRKFRVSEIEAWLQTRREGPGAK